MNRIAKTALAALASTVVAGAAQADQFSCTKFFNNDFSVGSAFWPVDIELGEFGRTGTGVFTSFAPLSLLPNQGNVATFFTEALAQDDHEFQLGSAANSTVFLRRQFVDPDFLKELGASGVNGLQFLWGGQLSFIMIGNNAEVRWNVTLIVRNLHTGEKFKCVLVNGSERPKLVVDGKPVQEGIIDLGVNIFNQCDRCQGIEKVLGPGGDPIEIQLAASVRADCEARGEQSAFIGGPIFFDDFTLCRVRCHPGFFPADPADPQPVAAAVTSNTLQMLPGETADEVFVRILDENGNGEIDNEDMELRAARFRAEQQPAEPALDVDQSGSVDSGDVTVVIASMNGEYNPAADLNADGVVDRNDLVKLLESMGN